MMRRQCCRVRVFSSMDKTYVFFSYNIKYPEVFSFQHVYFPVLHGNMIVLFRGVLNTKSWPLVLGTRVCCRPTR